jgi:hypothetical protein
MKTKLFRTNEGRSGREEVASGGACPEQSVGDLAMTHGTRALMWSWLPLLRRGLGGGVLLLCCLVCTFAHAQKKTFVRDYTYQASELDSKVSARTNAIAEMRNILLSEVGQYIHVETSLETNETSQDFSQKIEAITAGIVEMKILPEWERWDGATYYIKAEMTVDPAEVNKRIAEVLNDKQQTQEVEEARKRVKDAEAKIVELKELAIAGNRNNAQLQADYQYQTRILESNEYLMRGNIALSNGWDKEAIEEYNKAHAQMPNNEATHLFMGGIYGKVHTEDGCNLSIKSYKKYLETNPNSAEVWILVGNTCRYCDRDIWGYNCSYAYYYEKAIQYYKNVIMSDPSNAAAYDKLAEISEALGKSSEARTYSNKAAELRKKEQEREMTFHTVSGVVTNKKGKPLAGVSIVRTSGQGASDKYTITDADGKYTISARMDDELAFSFLGFYTEYVSFSGNTTINVRMQKYSKGHGGGTFLSYIYDSSPLKAAGPMHGVSLFAFRNYRWGWYASFRANSSFFQAKPTQPVSAFAFNVGAILRPSNIMSLYFGPGIGQNKYNDVADASTKKDDEWYFNPEAGAVLNFRYFSLFGGLKYPLPKNDQYEKILFSAGAGVNIGNNDNADELEDGAGDYIGYPFWSYMIDIPVSSTTANPPGFIGITGGLINNIGGVYFSFRGNAFMFGGGKFNDDESARAHFSLSGGGLIRLLYPVYLSVGLGAYWEWSNQTPTWGWNFPNATAYLTPEIGLNILCYNSVLLSFGRTFPGFTNDKVIYTAGIGWVIKE